MCSTLPGGLRLPVIIQSLQQWHGRYLYFSPAEVEPLDPEVTG